MREAGKIVADIRRRTGILREREAAQRIAVALMYGNFSSLVDDMPPDEFAALCDDLAHAAMKPIHGDRSAA